MPAQLERADLEGHPGPGGALGEDHPQRLARQWLLLVAATLHPLSEGEHGEQLGFGEVGDGEEVARQGIRGQGSRVSCLVSRVSCLVSRVSCLVSDEANGIRHLLLWQLQALQQPREAGIGAKLIQPGIDSEVRQHLGPFRRRLLE